MSNTISSWFIPFWYSAASGENTTLEMINKRREELKAKNEEPSFPKTLTRAKAVAGGVGILGILGAIFGFSKDNNSGKIFGIGVTVLGVIGWFVDKVFVKGADNNTENKNESETNGKLDDATLTKKLESFRAYRKQAIDYVGVERLANHAKKDSTIPLDKRVFVVSDANFSSLFGRQGDACTVTDKHRFIKYPDEVVQALKSRGHTDEDIDDDTALLNFVVLPGHVIYPKKLFDNSAFWGEEISCTMVTHEMYEQIWHQKTYNEEGINGRKQVAQLTKTFNSIASDPLVSEFVENITEEVGQYEKDFKEDNFAHELWAQLDCCPAGPKIRDEVISHLEEIKEFLEREHPEAMKIHREILAEAKKRAGLLYDKFHSGYHMSWDDILK